MRHEYGQGKYLTELVGLINSQKDPLPRVVEIQPTDKCNHRCSYCFHGGMGHKISARDDELSLEQYGTLFEELKHLGIKKLSVAGGGEPFIDTRLPQILELALGNQLEVRIVTHGGLVKGDIVNQIVRCEEIRFSIDAIHPGTYSVIRNVDGRQLISVLNNMDRLIGSRNNSESKLQIGATFLISIKNIDELEEFCGEMLQRGVDRVVIKTDIYRKHDLPMDRICQVADSVSKTFSNSVEFRSPITSATLPKLCLAPYFMAVINPYGDVFSCPLAAQPGEENGYRLGGLRGASLEQVWLESTEVRKMMSTGGVKCNYCNYTDIKVNAELQQLLE